LSTYPAKLRPGSHIRVVAPSRSLAILDDDVRTRADERLRALDLRVSFGDHAEVIDDFASSPVRARLDDLHAAFADPDVDAILTVIGGFNSNQLLEHIDYDLIRAHPKVLCGFSDITALSNAILARSDLVTYSGPHYSSFGMKHHFDYTEHSFRECLFNDMPLDLVPSPNWSDDLWFQNQDDRRLEPNDGWWVLNRGAASGTIVGGNLCTLNLLQGTPFMPPLHDTIVFVEDDAEVRPWDFDRNLTSLIQQPSFKGARAVVIGRFQRETRMTRDLLTQIVATKPALDAIPVLANVDFGHCTPVITFPIGGRATIAAESPADVAVRLDEH
jgi:muramoyltetrapeptide carboxypeptidase LdcA involved in peptidoglycan recycling